MTKEELLKTVKENGTINTNDHDEKIIDVIEMVILYCNINPNRIPDGVEPIVRRKVKTQIAYEEANGMGYQKEIASIKEGDGQITYASSGGSERENIYNLNNLDKQLLKTFRRLRGYA